jgi:hypothetical protein
LPKKQGGFFPVLEHVVVRQRFHFPRLVPRGNRDCRDEASARRRRQAASDCSRPYSGRVRLAPRVQPVVQVLKRQLRATGSRERSHSGNSPRLRLHRVAREFTRELEGILTHHASDSEPARRKWYRGEGRIR